MMQTRRTSKRPAYHVLPFFLPFFFIAAGFTRSTTVQSDTGKVLYEHSCSRCHGVDGTKGFLGAKNLQKSVLSDATIAERIQNGKRIMPSFRKKFTPEEIQQVVLYIKTLRTN